MPTNAFTNAAIAPETSEDFLVLITIDSDELGEPLRFVASGEGVTSNGEEFEAFPCAFIPPEQKEDGRLSPARLRLDNIDQRMATHMREITKPLTCIIQQVLRSDPSTVQIAFPVFKLTGAKWTMTTMEASLTTPDDTDEPASAWSYRPSFARGLF